MSRRKPDSFFATVGAGVLTIVVLAFTFGVVRLGTELMSGEDHLPELVPTAIVVPFLPYTASSTEVTERPTPNLEPEAVPERVQYTYGEIINSCGYNHAGACVRVRSGPGTEHPTIASVRNGMVLRVGATVTNEDGSVWHRIIFDEWLRFPERLGGDWYIAREFVRVLQNEGPQELSASSTATSSKRIMVDRSEQSLRAYEGEKLAMEFTISTGLELTPTPRGTFTIYRKTPTRYMQGPLPWLVDQQYYDLPGVPWNMYFTEQGAVIHGAYWHDSFGKPYSHGCVNLRPEEAEKIYHWAEIGTTVVVQD